MTTAELIDIMRRAKSGDKDAFQAVYTHFFRPVYAYIARRVHHTKDAEDLAQQVFVRLYTSRTPFSDQGQTPLAYLFTMARNVVVTFLTKSGQAVQPIEDAETMVEPHDMVKSLERAQLIQNALATLPDDQRIVIEARFKKDLTTREIAMQLGKTEATVRQLQCRALRRLREVIED